MKSLLLIGGVLGFLGGFVFSFIQKEPWLACLWHGGLSAFLSSLLLTWWSEAWSQNMKDSTPERQNASGTMLSTSTHPNTSQS
jgi:hypothetical protein